MQKYYGSYDNSDYRISYKGKEYCMLVSVRGEGWYTPGTMYRSNGDPGDPPDGDWVIKEIEITQIKVWNDDQDTWENLTDYSDEFYKLKNVFKDIIEEELTEDDFTIHDFMPENEEED